MKLRHLIQAAGEHVPFYREHWHVAGITTAKLDDIDPASLPLVSKSDLITCDTRWRLDSRRELGDLHFERSSGSSGEPFTIYFDGRTKWRRQLRFVRALLGVGYRPGHKLMLLANRRVSRPMQLARWHYAELGGSEGKLAEQYLSLCPDVLYGPLSALLALADTLQARTADHHQPRLVICTAEQLIASHLPRLHAAFGAQIADFYGMSELGLVAWRAPAANFFRTADDGLLLEFLPSGRADGLERLVVTDLCNRACPMIRFDTGDLVQRVDTAQGKKITRFAGREMDCLSLPDGRKISPYRAEVRLEGIPGVEQYQVVQHRDLSVEVFIWTRLEDPAAALACAKVNILAVLEHKLPVTVRHLAAPRPHNAEKFRPVRCEAIG